MKYKFVSLDNPNWNAQTRDMMRKLGVEGNYWPDEGMSPRMVDGIKVWVTPRAPKAGAGVRKSSTHRVLCECPGCGDVMSAGRLFQHKCIRAHNPRKRRRPLGQLLDRMRRDLLSYNDPIAYTLGVTITEAMKTLEGK